MSKIGISTLQSYQGAQTFEILGLNREVMDRCFNGAVSRIEGIGFDGIAEEVLVRHHLAYAGYGMGETQFARTAAYFSGSGGAKPTPSILKAFITCNWPLTGATAPPTIPTAT